MIVKNKNRDTIITKDLKIATSFFDRLLGLLNKNNSRSLLFYTRFGIHTFGLNSAIDVLVIDKSSTVRVLKTLKPNRLFFYNPKYITVLELPQMSIEKSETKIGDKLIINS